MLSDGCERLIELLKGIPNEWKTDCLINSKNIYWVVHE